MTQENIIYDLYINHIEEIKKRQNLKLNFF